MKCQCKTAKGSRCKRNASVGAFCKTHSKKCKEFANPDAVIMVKKGKMRALSGGKGKSPRKMDKCSATLKTGGKCKNKAKTGGLCGVHSRSSKKSKSKKSKSKKSKKPTKTLPMNKVPKWFKELMAPEMDRIDIHDKGGRGNYAWVEYTLPGDPKPLYAMKNAVSDYAAKEHPTKSLGNRSASRLEYTLDGEKLRYAKIPANSTYLDLFKLIDAKVFKKLDYVPDHRYVEVMYSDGDVWRFDTGS